MMKIENVNQLRGRAIGSMILAGFGAIWLGLAFYAKEMLNTATILYIVAGLLTLLAGSAKLRGLPVAGRASPEIPRLTAHLAGSTRCNGLRFSSSSKSSSGSISMHIPFLQSPALWGCISFRWQSSSRIASTT